MSKRDYFITEKILIGWQEWCGLPALKLPLIKAKIDTGAKTSAIHAIDIKRYKKLKKDWVSFKVHPLQADNRITMECHAVLLEQRHVMSSNGMNELRNVIQTKLKIAELEWDIQLTLSNRDPLKFRMLLGRQALGNHTIIDPHLVCHLGRVKRVTAEIAYNKIKKSHY